MTPEEERWTAAYIGQYHSLSSDYLDLQARALHQCARNLLSMEITPLSDGIVRGRYRASELLEEIPRLFVVGPPGSGKTALVADLSLELMPAHPSYPERAASMLTCPFVFVVSVGLLKPGERIDIPTLSRLSPAARAGTVNAALAERRAVVIVDGLDAAQDGPLDLIDSIVALADAHPGNRFVVTSRPLRTGIAGSRRVSIPGFVTAGMLPPIGPMRVYASYRFLGRRSPAKKAQLYLEQVDALLPANDPEPPPPGAVFPRFSIRYQRAIFAAIAGRMHHRRAFEIDPAEIVATLGPILWRSADGMHLRILAAAHDPRRRGYTPESAADLAPALVSEIRERSRLLVERRPDRFAFADFAFQEVLATLSWVHADGLVASLLDHANDRLWQGVFELAAGMPRVDAVAIVRELLSEEFGEPRHAVLASLCAEAAPDMPPALQRALSRRLADMVPPDNYLSVDRCLGVGDAVAPLLLRALPSCTTLQRAFSALLFGDLRHEPACGALVGLAADTSRVPDDLWWKVCGVEMSFPHQPVAMFALVALFEIARVSRVARSALGRALLRVPRTSIERLAQHLRVSLISMRFGDTDPERDPDLLHELHDQLHATLVARARETPKPAR